MTVWSKYGKALVAVAIAAVTALQAGLADGHVSTAEAVQIAIALFTALGVWLVPIVPQFAWVKTAIAVVLSVLNVLVSLIVGGISSADVTVLVLAALTSLGVAAAPAASDPPQGTSVEAGVP